MGTIAITFAPNFAKRHFKDVINKAKDENFLLIYQQSNGDSTGDKIYNLWLYQQVGGTRIRQEENLADVLDFVASNYKNVQIINADDVNGDK